MKLKDLIQALAEEVDIMQPQLEETLEALVQMDNTDDSFLPMLDEYNDYATRMGEAAEMVGLTGLQSICQQVQENTLLLAVSESTQRQQVIEFLHKWPVLMSQYLHHLEDPSIAAGLVDLCLLAPIPFDEEQALKVMHHLGTMALQATEGALFQDPDNQRPITATPEDVNLDMPDDIDQPLIDSFLQESPEIALQLVSWAQSLPIDTAQTVDSESIKTAKRYVHTLKGTGATVGIKGLATLGHHFEDILEYLENHPEHLLSVKNIILDASYCLEHMVSYIAEADDYPEQSLSVLQSVLEVANRIDNDVPLDGLHLQGDKLTKLADLPEASETNAYQSMVTANDQLTERSSSQDSKPDGNANGYTSDNTNGHANEHANGNTNANAKTTSANNNHTRTNTRSTGLRIPLEKVDELFRVSGEISIHTSAMEDKIKSLSEQAKQLLEQNIRVQKRLFELETLVDVRALSLMRGRMSTVGDKHSGDKHNGDKHGSDKKDFDPLEMDQYNELHSSAHALVEESADSREVAHKIEEEIALLSSMQSRQQVLSRDLQHLVIGTRMSEVGGLEARLQRNIRTTSQMTGKSATLVMTGKETLIDSDVLNKLAEPLLHLVRNAIDHGIEDIEERDKKGKAITGTIYLDFFRQGQQVILRCEDDGRGLNLEKIRQRAVSKGIITASQDLSDDEVARLIMTSGFSSRDNISEISGRGVGLDVVRNWVNNMNGSIDIRQGQHGGCLFELRFAASLSTIQSLVVKVEQALYALPAVQIEQAVPKSVGRFDFTNDRMLYYHNEQVIPARFLANLTGIGVDCSTNLNQYDAVIITINNQRYALAVNELIDSRELLVKPPGRYARHLQGVSGLSILGNGTIATHLDLTQLVSEQQTSVFRQQTASNQVAKPNVPNVLIVDDALTVRASLQQFIDDVGYQTQTARDGMEAINVMKNFTPDVILTDLEMPNMNGIELTQHVRHREDINTTPIIMITSRSQHKHRQLAEQAGVDTYITKPYHDLELLQSINQYLNK